MTPLFWDALSNTLWIGITVAFLSGLFAAFFAWLLTRTHLPFAPVLERVLSAPYSLPAYLLALAWMILGNPTVGFLKDFLPSSGITSLWGIILVETSVAFVFPFQELTAGFKRLDPSLEEAARMSGASAFKTFRMISLPLLFPALISGMTLSFLYAISSFGVPALLGMPARKLVLTTLIYSQFRLGGEAGLQNGLKLSLILLGFSIVALGLLHWRERSHNRARVSLAGGKTSRPSRVDLGRARFPLFLLPLSWISATLLLPWLALGISTFAQGPGQYAWEGFGLQHLRDLASQPLLQEALTNSVLLAVGIALLVTAASFWMAFKEVRRECKIARAISEVLLLPFASPGSTLALLWLTTLSFLAPGSSFPLISIAVCAALKYFAVGIRSFRTAFRQVDPVLEEAARLSGAELFPLLTRIWAPLLSQTFLSVLFLVSMPVLTELTMSVLLTGPGAATLGTLLFQLQEYANPSAAQALAFLLLTLALMGSLGMGARKSLLPEGDSR